MECFQESLKITNSKIRFDFSVQVLELIGQTCTKMKDYDNAMSTLNKLLKMNEKRKGNELAYSKTMNLVATVFLNQTKYDDALGSYQ